MGLWLYERPESAVSGRFLKNTLWKRLQQATQVIVLVGGSTRYLYKYVRREIEVALGPGLPIIVVNLNQGRKLDQHRCPPILRDKNVLHIPFKMAAIRYALENFPVFLRSARQRGPWIYDPSTYRKLGID